MRRVILDENIPKIIYDFLIQKNIEVIHISLLCKGATDATVISMLELETDVLITFDDDFSEMIFAFGHRTKGSLIFIRKFKHRDILCRQLFYVLQHMKKHSLVVIDSKKIRTRLLPE